MGTEVADLISRYPGPVTEPQVLAGLRAAFPGLNSRQAERLVNEAVATRQVIREGATLRLVEEVPTLTPTSSERVLRAVAFDVESVVRLSASRPDMSEARIFQLGAMRFGRDTEWCAAQPTFDKYVDLPGPDWEIRSDTVRQRWTERSRPPREVLEEFSHYIADADLLVAYNGTSVDFPLLTDALHREGLAPPDGLRLVDGYYLALALWPTPPRQHRLRDLADRVGAKLSGLEWHVALDDAVLLVELLGEGANVVRSWSAELQSLVRSVTRDSPAWDLLFEMAILAPTERTWADSEVTEVVGALLSVKPPRRPPSEPEGRTPVLLHPPRSVMVNGRVSPFELAVAAGRTGERRPAQQAMVDEVQAWIDAGHAGLVEAPTGTGKSYALLANALDWLAGDPARKVIISTFTKQLQAQMAADIEALAGVVPGLAQASDMVKGKANRLSLRGLVTAVADCTETDPSRRATRRTPYARDLAYREFVAFATLRLGAPATLAEEWEGRSVDGPDVPAFFTSYCAPRLPGYLASLSQAQSGDYSASAALGEHTDEVSEAVANHRLIVANHALLLASREALSAQSESTLLFVDEAHMLEDAATSALSATIDYPAVEQITFGVERWLADARRHPARDQVVQANQELERFLDGESLPQAAMQCFDEADGSVGSRTVTITSPRHGLAGLRNAVHLVATVRRAHHYLQGLAGALYDYQSSGAMGDDHFAIDRFRAELSRVTAALSAATALIADADDILGPGEVIGDDPPVEVETPAADDEMLAPEADVLALLVPSTDEDAQAPSPRAAPLASNRVIWAEETGQSDLAASNRRYRFRLTTSPIALPREPAWTHFTALIRRTFYVSATLTVSGEWTYLRSRLGLDATTTPGVVVPSPFDLATQARLVCFADFPSWSETAEQATRTLAWQVAQYLDEVAHRHEEESGTWDNGALVLTTSRDRAGAIVQRLEELLATRDSRPPVHPATLLGNARAVDNFQAVGGALVGTRGLWQGIDVSDAQRLRLVWINKVPFAPFANPVIAARRALAAEEAEYAGAADPEQVANENYYLPLAVIALRQAVGRLIRSNRHRGAVIISDPHLSGPTPLRQAYRRILLGSLDPGLLIADPETGETGGGNVVTMTEGWRRIWEFLAETGVLAPERARELVTGEALRVHTLTPETREILSLALAPADESLLRESGGLATEMLGRARRIGELLRGHGDGFVLKEKQVEVIEAVAQGHDVLAVLPTGYGKSFAFQLPALVLPGVTIVVSPLISLMHHQTLELNRSIGGAVRALVAPLTVSNSRLGKADVQDALMGRDDHGIRIVYLSPERLCSRQFQELIEHGVARGIVRRIAIDEAHTAIQWGDDFRPSYRRTLRYLRDLRARHPELALTALTATANPTVLEGLREAVFGLAPRPDGDEPGFTYVGANPIRPELAIYRRTLAKHEGGPLTVAGLVEGVLGALDGHAIFYCLTVKEVNALWAQLRDMLGPEGAARVRRYHARLTEAEKAAVISDFITAPRFGDDDFTPIIVVATSAFGLGIDREDIRCVFVVSPPTDLAALYQQLGRAGRDRSAQPVDPDGPTNVGLALGTQSGFSLVRWMTRQGDQSALLLRVAASLFELGTEPSAFEYVSVDAVALARQHLDADATAGLLSTTQRRSAHVDETYQTGVARVVAALADLGAVEDLGDFPSHVKVNPGVVEPGGDIAEVVAAILARVPMSHRVEVADLHRHLTSTRSDYHEMATEPGATWALLVDLHALGYLDVSQGVARSTLTGLVLAPATVGPRVVPAVLIDHLSRRTTRAVRECQELEAWYQATDCANAGFARYFQVDELPGEVCRHGVTRCSACWNDRTVAESGEPLPPLLTALRRSRPRPNSATAAGRPLAERTLDMHVDSLLWENRGGLTPGIIGKVLRGDDSYFSTRTGTICRLWPPLYETRHRGSSPGASINAVEASLDRLRGRGVAVRAGALWRLTRYVEEDALRAARAAANSDDTITNHTAGGDR